MSKEVKKINSSSRSFERIDLVDTVSKEKRSEIMSKVGHINTAPELRVRSALHRRGYRFRLHKKTLPGTPDIVLPKYKIAIFVNGCFWHGHHCKKGQNLPKTNSNLWEAKILKNKIRDLANLNKLRSLGWIPLLIWECEITRDIDVLGSCLEGQIRHATANDIFCRLDNRELSSKREVEDNER